MEVVQSACGVPQRCNMDPFCCSLLGSLQILKEFRPNPHSPGARAILFIAKL